MLPDEQPIDTTPILAQPQPFAQKMRQLERERENLIAQVAQLRRLLDDEKAVARAYILRTERAELDVARLTAALAKSRPWKDYGDWRVVCIHCRKLVDANSELGISAEHEPTCVWLRAVLLERPAPATGRE